MALRWNGRRSDGLDVIDLVVVNGTVVHADGSHPGWVGVTGARVVGMGAGEPPPARRTVDAAGCLVLPGVVDGHVHGRGTTT